MRQLTYFELGKEERKRFLLDLVTELSKAYALCAMEPEARELNAEIGFLKAVKAGLLKIVSPGTDPVRPVT